MDLNHDLGTIGNVTAISSSTGVVTFSGTAAMMPPAGTTAERPLSPLTGAYRFNTTINDMELWNGSAWVPMASANSVVSFILSSWTSVSGSFYYCDMIHNLGTKNISTTIWNTVTNQVIIPESITTIDDNTVRVVVKGSGYILRGIIVSAGTFNGYSGNPIIRTLTYYASSLDSPNNSDWAVNSLAAAVADPVNPAIIVRQFSNTTEQGVGFNITVPADAAYVRFSFKGRAQTTPVSASVVQPKIYMRAIPNNAAIPAWSGAIGLANIAIPTNAYYQYNSQTYSLVGAGLTPGGLYQVELTRSTTVTGGTNLPSNWYLAELTIEFMA